MIFPNDGIYRPRSPVSAISRKVSAGFFASVNVARKTFAIAGSLRFSSVSPIADAETIASASG